MTSMRRRKRRGQPEREYGVDNTYDHHTVLYELRLLDDDDNCDLFCQMRQEEEELGESPSLEQWNERLRQLATPTAVNKQAIQESRAGRAARATLKKL